MSKIPKDVVITSALRTPIGKYKGSLKNISADRLGALVIKEAIFKINLSKSYFNFTNLSIVYLFYFTLMIVSFYKVNFIN